MARPQTYMNRSGESVGRLVNKFKVGHENLLVIYDDMDLPPGKLRIRSDGSSGGHHGMESIIQALGGQDFPRLRVGIGRPENENTDVVTYLLSGLPPEAKEAIHQVLPRVSDAIFCILTEGVTAAMNKFN